MQRPISPSRLDRTAPRGFSCSLFAVMVSAGCTSREPVKALPCGGVSHPVTVHMTGGPRPAELRRAEIEPVNGPARPQLLDPALLKALLPERLPGLRRTSLKSEKLGAVGFEVSFAEAQYQAQADASGKAPSILIRVTDLAGVGGPVGAGWLRPDDPIDEKTEAGYQRTTMLMGHPALEDRLEAQDRSEIHILAWKRFHIEAAGANMSMDDVKSALSPLRLEELEAQVKTLEAAR